MQVREHGENHRSICRLDKPSGPGTDNLLVSQLLSTTSDGQSCSGRSVQTTDATRVLGLRYYGREIAAYDIQTKRVDVYGQGTGLSERGMLIYDGLHYDALALAPCSGAPEETDITIFDPEGPLGEVLAKAADGLVAKVGHTYRLPFPGLL
jgi:hypothetical protein